MVADRCSVTCILLSPEQGIFRLSYPCLSVFIRGCFLTVSVLSETIYLDPVPRSRVGLPKTKQLLVGPRTQYCRNSADDRIERHRNGAYRRAAHKKTYASAAANALGYLALHERDLADGGLN